MAIHLIIEGGPFPDISRADVARRTAAILEAATDLPDAELSLLLTGDERIRELNRAYRKKDRPTDVLAFAQQEGEFAGLSGHLLGDVVVSVPTARRQAQSEGRPLIAEVTMLVAHGVLHLLGWDHETARKDKRMRLETERLCVAAEAASRAKRPQRAPKRAANKRTANERPLSKRAASKRAASKRAASKPSR